MTICQQTTGVGCPLDSKVDGIKIIIAVMLALMTIIVGTGSWIRAALMRAQLGVNDFCILSAWLLAVAFDLDLFIQLKYGLGIHKWMWVADTHFEVSLHLAYFGEMMYYICVAITKLAILLLYVRLTTSRRLQIAIYATGLVAVSSALAFTIVTIFQCEPISEAWDVTGTVEGTCLSVRAMFYAQAASDISQDLIVFVLPIKMLYKMQLPRRQNYALVPVFAIGAFVVISGCLRLFYIQRAEYSTDPSYEDSELASWSVIKCNVGVICATLPHFKAGFDRFFPRLMGNSQDTDQSKPSFVNRAASSGSRLARRRYIKQKETEAGLELESGKADWSEDFAGTYEDNHVYEIKGHCPNMISNIKGRCPNMNVDNSQEDLTELEAEGGIYKTTRVTVSSTPV